MWFREGENGNVIEKVEEVKETGGEGEKVSAQRSQLGNYASETFSRKLAESCPYRRLSSRWERARKKNLRDGGLPLPSRWRPGNHAPLKGGGVGG